jgi:hypothetical protein
MRDWEACRHLVEAAILAASQCGFQPRVPKADTVSNCTLSQQRNCTWPPERRTPIRPGPCLKPVHADSEIGAPFYWRSNREKKIRPVVKTGLSSKQ